MSCDSLKPIDRLELPLACDSGIKQDRRMSFAFRPFALAVAITGDSLLAFVANNNRNNNANLQQAGD
jgi:hypothetical protein